MNKALKAALFSALVFPGAGHIVVKKHFTGALFISSTLSALAILIYHATKIANQISDKILYGQIPLDAALISNLISEKLQQGHWSIDAASIFILIIWLLSTFDAYRSAKMPRTQ